MELSDNGAGDGSHTLEVTAPDGVTDVGLSLQGPPGLRGNGRAFTAAPAATACSQTADENVFVCTFMLGPRQIATANLTAKVGFTVRNATMMTLVMDGEAGTSQSLKLGVTSPISDLVLETGESGIRAGITATDSIVRLVPTADGPSDFAGFGTITIPRHTGNGLYIGPSGPDSTCVPGPAESPDTLQCEQIADSLDYGPITVTALPRTSGEPSVDITVPDYQEPDEADGTTKLWTLNVPVAPRSPGDPMDITGSFAGAAIGQSTTSCLLVVCHYENSMQAVAPGTSAVALAELTWIGPKNTAFGGETRQVIIGDRQPFSVVGTSSATLTGTASRFAVHTADVTDALNTALQDQSGNPILITMPGPLIDLLGPDEVTGWALTVVWTTDGTDQHISTARPDDVANETPPGPISVADDGEPIRSIGTLLLWDQLVKAPTTWQGTFCGVGQVDGNAVPCAPHKTTLNLGEGGSADIRLSQRHPITILGPTFVQREPSPAADEPPPVQTSAALPRP